MTVRMSNMTAQYTIDLPQDPLYTVCDKQLFSMHQY